MKRSRIAAWSWAQHYVASSRKADGASVLLENLRKEPGYSDEDEFWSDFVSEKMTAAEFVRTLAAFLPSTAPDPDDDMSGDELEDSLALARKDGEPWFRDDPDDPPRKYHDFARLEPRSTRRRSVALVEADAPASRSPRTWRGPFSRTARRRHPT